jgi:hypothetical protein
VPRAFRELITRHLRDTLHTSQKMCVPGDEPAHHPFGSGGCAPPHFQGRFRCPVGVWVGSFVFRSFASCVFACAWRADGDGQRVFDPTSLPVGLALVLVGLAAVLVAPAALPPGLLTVLASLAAVLASLAAVLASLAAVLAGLAALLCGLAALLVGLAGVPTGLAVVLAGLIKQRTLQVQTNKTHTARL